MTAPTIREVSDKVNTSFDQRGQLKYRRFKSFNIRSESLILLDNGYQGVKVFRNFPPTAMGFDVHLLEPMYVFESLSRSLDVADEQEVLFAASYSLWLNI